MVADLRATRSRVLAAQPSVGARRSRVLAAQPSVGALRSPPRRAWVLNFDADDELADPGRATRSRAMEARAGDLVRAAVGLVPDGDLVLGLAGGREDRADGLLGRCFCPTPRARATLERAGALLPVAPSLAVLRRVNHRRFAADLGQTLRGARFVERREELDEVIGQGGPWLLKRPFGFAGRERLRVERGLTEAEARWVERSFARDGLQVEPWVARAGDFGLHGFLARDGQVLFGAPTSQICDERGAWRGTRVAPPGSLSGDEERSLFEAAEQAARALAGAGFFGPFGIDAFRYLADGVGRWNPRCEINARYSMGWATGMGLRRPDLASDA